MTVRIRCSSMIKKVLQCTGAYGGDEGSDVQSKVSHGCINMIFNNHKNRKPVFLFMFSLDSKS